MNIVRDTNPGAYAVKVPCLECGKMRLLADMLIDRDGPAFKAYYCQEHGDAARFNRCSHDECHVPATRIVALNGKRAYTCGNHEADRPR